MFAFRRVLGLLATITVVVAGSACTAQQEEPGSLAPEEVVRRVEQVAGLSDWPQGKLGLVPYDLPVLRVYRPSMVGNAAVYFDSTKDTYFVVRLMRKGPQTLIYIGSDKAGDAGKAVARYNFTFPSLPDMELRTTGGGAVYMHDIANLVDYPFLGQPWAKALDGRVAETGFEISDNVVTQWVSLEGARFPVVADPPFEDPYVQIMTARVPDMKRIADEMAREARKDGPSHDLGPYGRWYTGPNGLEIRLNNRGSLVVLDYVRMGIGAASSAGAGARAMLGKSGNKLSDMLLAVVASLSLVAEALKPVFSDHLQNDVLPNYCIGVTIPRDQFGSFTEALVWLSSVGVVYENIRIGTITARTWPEPCDSAKPLIKLPDQPAPPPPPPAAGDVTQPATPAQPLPPTKKVAPPPPPPAPAFYDISVDEACQMGYSDPGARSQANDLNRYDSWVCILSSGGQGPVDMNRYCAWKFPGSTATHLDNTAYSWRCKKG